MTLVHAAAAKNIKTVMVNNKLRDVHLNQHSVRFLIERISVVKRALGKQEVFPERL